MFDFLAYAADNHISDYKLATRISCAFFWTGISLTVSFVSDSTAAAARMGAGCPLPREYGDAGSEKACPARVVVIKR